MSRVGWGENGPVINKTVKHRCDKNRAYTCCYISPSYL